MLLIYADLHISFCWVGSVDIQLTCRPCWPLTSGGISWTTVVLRGFTQQLSSGLSSGRTRQYTFKSENILHQLRFFPVHCIISCFCNNQFFCFFHYHSHSRKFNSKNDMHCHLLRETLKNHKNPIFAKKQKVTNLSLFTQNFVTSEKKPH